MLWAVPAKSPVAPRALAVLAFFLLLTLYLTWPLPLRMGSGLSTNPDSLLNFWAMAWSYHILPLQPLSLFDANIFASPAISVDPVLCQNSALLKKTINQQLSVYGALP